jgi:hypothetical protein
LRFAVCAALLGAAMVAAVWGDVPVALRAPGSVPSQPTMVPPTQPRPPFESAEPDVPQSTVHLASWVGYLISGVCIAIVLGLVIALIWTLLRDRLGLRRTPSDVTDPAQVRRQAQEAVRAAVDEGLADLDVADADPRRAVIACWVRLEAAAAAAGTERQPGDTSTELVQRLLAEHAVSAPVLAGFAEVYRWARFATHEVDETMRQRARAALLQVRDELLSDVAGAS